MEGGTDLDPNGGGAGPGGGGGSDLEAVLLGDPMMGSDAESGAVFVMPVDLGNHLDYSNDTYPSSVVYKPVWEIVLKTTFYVPLIVMAIVGNVLVMVVVAKDKRMRTTTNYYIVNLAVADCLVTLSCSWVHLVDDLTPKWVLGAFFCKFNSFAQVDVVSGSEWTAVPPPMVYSCKGKTLQLLWTLQIDQHAETVDSIKWFFRGTNSSELVATFLHGQFLPGLKYSSRVDQMHGSGVTISDVTPSDSGTYSIEVTLRKGDAPMVTLSQSVSAQVGDGMMLENSRLEVTQDPVASWNTTSSTWHIRLLCGRFTFKGESPISVEWELSTGETPQSSGYEGGHFYLTLPRAHLFESVSYTCRIPERFYPNMCMNKNTKPGITAATFLLDEVKARLTLAEAELGRVGEENAHLQNQLTDAEKEITEILTGVKKNITELQDLTLLECSSSAYTTWDDRRRDVNNTVVQTACDNTLQTKWYRLFLDGKNAVLPTTCPPSNRCGTSGSTWLDLQGRELPKPGHELAARACSHWNDCCYNSIYIPVTVRNCGSFFMYKLQATLNCDIAYCFQKAN